MEDSKAEIKADLEGEGKKKGEVVGQWKEVLRSEAATVVRTDPSCLVVKMENGEVDFEGLLLTNQAQCMISSTFGHIFVFQVGLQILEEETMMTKEPRDWATIDASIAIGDKVKH